MVAEKVSVARCADITESKRRGGRPGAAGERAAVHGRRCHEALSALQAASSSLFCIVHCLSFGPEQQHAIKTLSCPVPRPLPLTADNLATGAAPVQARCETCSVSERSCQESSAYLSGRRRGGFLSPVQQVPGRMQRGPGMAPRTGTATWQGSVPAARPRLGNH